MDEVEVDLVLPDTLEARLYGDYVVVVPDLGGDEQVPPLVGLDRVCDHLLAVARSVALRGVDMGYSQLDAEPDGLDVPLVIGGASGSPLPMPNVPRPRAETSTPPAIFLKSMDSSLG